MLKLYYHQLHIYLHEWRHFWNSTGQWCKWKCSGIHSHRYSQTLKSIYDYDPEQKKYIMWAVGTGTVIGTIPTNWLVVNYGAKWPFLIAGLVSAGSTVMIPFAAKNSYFLLLFLRFLQVSFQFCQICSTDSFINTAHFYIFRVSLTPLTSQLSESSPYDGLHSEKLPSS